MQRIPRVDEVHWLARVLVSQKTRADDLDVGKSQLRDLRLQRREHRPGHVRHDPATSPRDLDGELAGPSAELHHHRLPRQTKAVEQSNLAGRARVLLGVIPGNVIGVQVLPEPPRVLWRRFLLSRLCRSGLLVLDWREPVARSV